MKNIETNHSASAAATMETAGLLFLGLSSAFMVTLVGFALAAMLG